ncbi:MAG: bifunctional nuclease family protein [Candidatus Nanohaloarchaea archaeon]
MDRGTTSIIMLAVLTGLVTAPLLPSPGQEVSTSGYEKVDDVKASGNILAFRSGCRLLEMVVSRGQSEAINRGLSDVETRRPMTHDLLISILKASGAEVEAVKIHSLVNGSYRAYLVLDTLKGIEKVDSRPSDATAVAVREETPILVSEKLLKAEAVNVCGEGSGEIV